MALGGGAMEVLKEERHTGTIPRMPPTAPNPFPSHLPRKIDATGPPRRPGQLVIGTSASARMRSVDSKMASDIRKVLFGDGWLNAQWGKEWAGQSFEWNPNRGLEWGLLQREGGPCGLLAAIQGQETFLPYKKISPPHITLV